MPVFAIDLPKQSRKSQYDYSGDVDNIREMLANGQTPGDGPFDSTGKARSAANALLTALGDDGKEYGSRVVEREDGFYFGLKKGRKEYKGRADKGNAKKGDSKKS